MFVMVFSNLHNIEFYIKSYADIEKDRRQKSTVSSLVGVARLELAASWSRTMRATICATPRNSFLIIMTNVTVVKKKSSNLS